MFKTLHPLPANSSRHLSVLLELPYTSREAKALLSVYVLHRWNPSSLQSSIGTRCGLFYLPRRHRRPARCNIGKSQTNSTRPCPYPGQLSAFNTRSSGGEHLFVRTHVAAYFICLLVSDLFQGLPFFQPEPQPTEFRSYRFTLNATWVRESMVYVGDTCTAQGVLKQISDVSIAFWTLVIAIHTFCLLVLELHLRQFVLWVTLIAGWCSIATIVVAGPAALDPAIRGPFYGISGYWCWISPGYESERVTLDYMFMFISAIVSFVLYTLIFLRLRGNLYFNQWRPSFRWKSIARVGNWRATDSDNQAAVIAKHMILYPIAYTVVFLPVAVTRLSAFSGHIVSLEITIFSSTLYLLSGTVNVVLFASARNILPPSSMVIKKWTISLPRMLQPGPRDSTGIDPYYIESENSYHRTQPMTMPQISPLWIQQEPSPPLGERDLATRGPEDIEIPHGYTTQSTPGSSDYYEDEILNTYEDVDLGSDDSMVLAPISDPVLGASTLQINVPSF
ncbi:hypothetical protein BDZ89DRAFT_1138632 [Hymenopellis radicata]|nr:hypothetical protein BDZ89DRAFT_1138632 [Hymenopellis radicata]